MSNKNIILCFRHQALFQNRKMSTFCGLGDILKSFVNVYIFCKQNGIGFYLNFDHHSIKKFLNFKKFDFAKTFKDIDVPRVVDFVSGSSFYSYVSESNEENIFLMTDGNNISNFCYIENLDTDFKEVFLSNEKITNYIKNQYSEPYNVFHARLGDGNMVSKDFLDDYYLRDFSHQYSAYDWYNSIDFEFSYNFLYKNFSEEISSSDFICSDHLSFKKFIAERSELRYVDFETVHLGIKNPIKNIEKTLYDFYILYHCDNAFSVSHYPFGKRASGFAYWIDKIFIKDFKYFSFDWLYKNIQPLKVY